MRRRDFLTGTLKALAAVPLVGPALLAVGSKVAGAPAECTVHMGVLTVPPGATYTTPMIPLGPSKGLTLAKLKEAKRILEKAADAAPRPDWYIARNGELHPVNEAILEAFYRGRG